MRQIAERLECSAMTPYRYFRNKDDIFAAVRAAALDRFSERLEAARDRLARLPDVVALSAMHTFVFAIEEPDAYRLIFDLSQPDETGYPTWLCANARSRKTMTGYMDDLVAAGVSGRRSKDVWPDLLGARTDWSICSWPEKSTNQNCSRCICR